jgi:hypothetical protein
MSCPLSTLGAKRERASSSSIHPSSILKLQPAQQRNHGVCPSVLGYSSATSGSIKHLKRDLLKCQHDVTTHSEFSSSANQIWPFSRASSTSRLRKLRVRFWHHQPSSKSTALSVLRTTALPRVVDIGPSQTSNFFVHPCHKQALFIPSNRVSPNASLSRLHTLSWETNRAKTLS